MEFALIKGGTFDRSALLRREGEVEIVGFLFGTSEVTVKQYLAYMDELPRGMIVEYEKKEVSVEEIPESALVSHVTYSNVLAFCERNGDAAIAILMSTCLSLPTEVKPNFHGEMIRLKIGSLTGVVNPSSLDRTSENTSRFEASIPA